MIAKANTAIVVNLCAGVLLACYTSIIDLSYVVAAPKCRQFDGS